MVSILPALLFSAWWADLERPQRLMDQNFGLGLYPDQLITPSVLERYVTRGDKSGSGLLFDPVYYRPWADLVRRYYDDGGGLSTITADKDTFKVILDVQHFKPEEISVKLVDRYVIVEGKHEEKKDEHGSISRHFVRKYYLPEQVNADDLTSDISSDGILTISAPLKELPEQKEKTIKINLTGKPALRRDADHKTTDSKKSSTTEWTSESASEETTQGTAQEPTDTSIP